MKYFLLTLSGCTLLGGLGLKIIHRLQAKIKSLNAEIDSLKTEREEQAILTSAISDAILAVDLEGSPLFYNSRLAVLLNDHALNQPQIRLWDIIKSPEILTGYREALQEGKTSNVKTIPFEHEAGTRFYSISISPLIKEKDSLYGAVGIFHDVTELKGAEQIRIDFVANVSHELRTPLTAIKGYADTLIQDLREGKPISPEFLEIINRNTDRLMSLINDLLDLSSLESTDVLHKTNLSTVDITQRVIQHMHPVFEAKKQELSTEFNSPAVVADPKRLEQVMINLLDNANKYTAYGSRISIYWETEGKDTVLKVRDSGPGIPPEHHLRLFERFYRLDKARSREQGGTGLGLAIVKHIMQRHDGSVWVESSPGRGATFICRFPP
jgi:two-component system phosphate regulon sensor histidine kinase PhoR